MPLATAVGNNDPASARVTRILDSVAWPQAARDIQPSYELLIGTTLGGQAADLLSQTADSAGGVIFGDMTGRVAFRARDWQTYMPGTPVDGTIGNVAPTDVCPVMWERPFARADITTRAIFGRDLESAVTADDGQGQIKYGIEPYERVDLLTASDASLLQLAQRVLRTRAAATAPRVRSVTLDARTSTAALDLMSSVEVYRPSRYRCRLQYPQPRGVVFDEEYFATGVVHTMTPSDWTLQLNLDVAAPYAAAGGRWDSSYWDQSLWADVAAAREQLELLEAHA
jgi:hypothetical protein